MTEPRTITTRAAWIWLDDADILHADCLPGSEQTLVDAEETMVAFWEMAGHRRLPVLVDLRRVKAIDRAARAHYAGPEGARVQRAAALVVGSPLSRMLGNVFLGFSNPLIPIRLFTAEPEALAWLRGFRA